MSDKNKKKITSTISDSLKEYFSEIKDKKNPKDIVGAVVQSALKSKDEISLKVAREITAFIQRIDFAKEIIKISETHKFKISAEVELVKKDKKSN